MNLEDHIKRLGITKAEFARRLSKQGKPVKPQYLNEMIKEGWIVIDSQLYRPTGYVYENQEE